MVHGFEKTFPGPPPLFFGPGPSGSVWERFKLSPHAQIGWSLLLFQATDLSLTKSFLLRPRLGMVHVLVESGHFGAIKVYHQNLKHTVYKIPLFLTSR